ncbi:MAG TPA: pantoate--beta-alanine ligase [Steroidobacteraceae bacterium]|nr:pantoate--beta-alanine ligase [Steroidobacteraceae bacterium]
MQVVTSIADVRDRVRAWRRAGARIAFVPTMGNLHAGHVSLIETARRHGDRFVASIFVNPMQFGPNEDFAHYPRTPQRDHEMLEAAGCDLMFMPDAAEMYPYGLEHSVRVEVPELSRILCGAYRPGHFEGVTTVVAKLFSIVAPDCAVFGEKDFQQLALIRRMTRDLCMPVEIIGAPTVREPDGLAMSSRNQYLSTAEREVAPALHQILMNAADRLAGGETDHAAIESEAIEALTTQGFDPDYVSIRRADDLEPAHSEASDLVVLAAARLGRARLIDNVRVTRR